MFPRKWWFRKEHLMHRKWLFLAKSINRNTLLSQIEARESGLGFPGAVLCCSSLCCLLLCFGHAFCLSESWEITHALQPITMGQSSPARPIPSFPGNLSNRHAMHPPDGLCSQRETHSCHSATVAVCACFYAGHWKCILESTRSSLSRQTDMHHPAFL